MLNHIYQAPGRRARTRAGGQRGFTLIELVMVIVILGVLAAVALPKFADLRRDSVMAATQNLAGALKTSSNLMRMKCATTPGCNLTVGESHLTINGQDIQMWLGWPDSGDDVGTNQIDMTLDHAGFSVSIPAATLSTRFTHQSATTPSTCYVDYREPEAAGLEPTITLDLSGC
jgi:MSHA pilin protein MshA